MSKRRTYHVTHQDGKWKVQEEGKANPVSTHAKKTTAVEAGRRAAKAEELGQLIIHGKDGQFQEERTYGKDPFPPKG